ncbi:MAG: hypothetical protein ACXAEX_17080 [Promethearchaeota archaeon]|jgi:hypothetical protein
MEKAKVMRMEMPKILNGVKIEPFTNKEKVGQKLDDLWTTKSSYDGKLRNEKKKLLIKLESSGKECRKISLKLESSNANVNFSNYYLLSELLKGFFSVGNNS